MAPQHHRVAADGLKPDVLVPALVRKNKSCTADGTIDVAQLLYSLCHNCYVLKDDDELLQELNEYLNASVE